MTLSTQFYTMLAMIAMGSFFGASLDTYQRLIKRTIRKRFTVFINDILFWIVQGLIAFYILYLVNYGELRVYLLLALLCGFSAYQALFKKLYNQMLETLIHFLKATARFLVKMATLFIYQPIKGICLFLLASLLYLLRFLLLLVKTIGKVVLWCVKLLTYPIFLLGKGIFYLFPASLKKMLKKFTSFLAGHFQKVKKIFIRVGLSIKKFLKKS